MMEIMARQSWYGVQSTMGEDWAGRGGWSHEPASVHPDPVESHVVMCDGVFGRNFVYVQDNPPPHTARDTAAFLDQQDVEVMDLPARSPDMNSIEHDWDELSVWIRDMDDPFHRSWTKQCCPLGVGCSSAREGADPGLESMPRCVRPGSSGR